MSCKYCDADILHGGSVWSYASEFLLEDNVTQIGLSFKYHPVLRITTWDDGPTYDREIDIDFCPKCGRDLLKGEDI